MLTSEPSPKPESVRVGAGGLHCPPPIPPLVTVVGPIIAAAAVATVVVLAAVTSWWVLFALFALPPLLMLVCAPLMMTAMRGPGRGGFAAAGRCAQQPSARSSREGRAT